jgi:hypothetical protein
MKDLMKNYYMYANLTAQEIEISLYDTLQKNLHDRYGDSPDKCWELFLLTHNRPRIIFPS